MLMEGKKNLTKINDNPIMTRSLSGRAPWPSVQAAETLDWRIPCIPRWHQCHPRSSMIRETGVATLSPNLYIIIIKLREALAVTVSPDKLRNVKLVSMMYLHYFGLYHGQNKEVPNRICESFSSLHPFCLGNMPCNSCI